MEIRRLKTMFNVQNTENYETKREISAVRSNIIFVKSAFSTFLWKLFTQYVKIFMK